MQYEGRRAIVTHSNSVKHKRMITARKESSTLTSFFTKIDSKDEDNVAKSEVMLVYHNIVHGLSYHSLDCLFKSLPSFVPDSS